MAVIMRHYVILSIESNRQRTGAILQVILQFWFESIALVCREQKRAIS